MMDYNCATNFFESHLKSISIGIKIGCYDIQCLVDVRRFPTSRFKWFKRERLAEVCKEAGLDYFYLGQEPGGYRKGGYEEYIKSLEFREALEELKKIAASKRTAFMCSERFPWKCHRRFIALELEREGWEVVHIIDKERTWQPKPS
ncbi:DUF488 domain-containing protein [Candidatus Hakubella thermalkaliphila]|nr:DUF488 domain-containing protein [Candidatus Hakubella thermalkaliphila]